MIKKLKAYMSYFIYICEHKKNVMKSYKVFKDKLPDHSFMKQRLFFRCLFHDMSKFGFKEFFPYARVWKLNLKDKDSIRKYNDAWIHHYRKNKHHPEYWDLRDMDLISIAEMMCDWNAMSIKFNDTPQLFYYKNVDRISISRTTRQHVEHFLGFLPYEISIYYGITWKEYCESSGVSLEDDFEKIFKVRPIKKEMY